MICCAFTRTQKVLSVHAYVSTHPGCWVTVALGRNLEREYVFEYSGLCRVVMQIIVSVSTVSTREVFLLHHRMRYLQTVFRSIDRSMGATEMK